MKITRRAGLRGLAAGAALLGMPALVRADEPEIIIGAPNSLTGGLGEIGQRMTWGLQIAVDQINREGGIKEQEAWIDVSNVALIDPDTGKPTRVKFEVRDGKKVRVAKSGKVIPIANVFGKKEPKKDKEEKTEE